MRYFIVLLYAAVMIPVTSAIYMEFFHWLHWHVSAGIPALGYNTTLVLYLWICLFALLYGAGKGFAQGTLGD